MRAKYYRRLARQMNFKVSFVFFLIAIIVILIIFLDLLKTIMPTVQTLCENKSKAIALQVTTETVKESTKDIEYNNLMNLYYDNQNKISGLSANVTRMNTLSAEISYKIQEKLEEITEETVTIPIGKILGWSIFSGFGPKVSIKIMPSGNVTADFRTEFVSEGINQTRHTIYIDVTTSVRTVAPFVSENKKFTTSLKIAETIIIGDIPQTYYNILEQGVDELSEIEDK